MKRTYQPSNLVRKDTVLEQEWLRKLEDNLSLADGQKEENSLHLKTDG